VIAQAEPKRVVKWIQRVDGVAPVERCAAGMGPAIRRSPRCPQIAVDRAHLESASGRGKGCARLVVLGEHPCGLFHPEADTGITEGGHMNFEQQRKRA